MEDNTDVAKNILEPLLKKIGWSLKFSGCEHYHIVNHLGTVTKWEIWKNELKLSGNSFCDDFSEKWVVSYDLLKADCELSDRESFVSVKPKNRKSNFILFMNHDKKRKNK